MFQESLENHKNVTKLRGLDLPLLILKGTYLLERKLGSVFILTSLPFWD